MSWMLSVLAAWLWPLGAIAHKSVITVRSAAEGFHLCPHAAEHVMPRGIRLIDSYHCSRYNTQTRRLTADMFAQVFSRARAILD